MTARHAPFPLLSHYRKNTTMPATYRPPLVLIPLIAGALLLSACGDASKPGAAAPSAQQPAENAGTPAAAGEKPEREEAGLIRLTAQEIEEAGIRLQTAEQREVDEKLALTATIRENQDRVAHVAPRVPARAIRISANLGDKVKAGQRLALLDSIELGEAHSLNRQAQSQYAVAQSDFVRAEKLRADEIISEKEFLRTKSEFEKSRAALRATEERLRLLDVTHGEGESGPASVFPLNAPFAGTIVEKHAILGELAQPDKNLFTVADLSTLWIDANLFEKDLGLVRLGAPADVTVNAYPGEVFRGKLTYISSTLNKDTRAVPARIEVPNPDGRLKPEMFATALISTGSTIKALTVPQEAILLVNRQPVVFVQSGDGLALRPVDPGEKIGGRVVVRDGLKPGEAVVVAGAFALKARLLKSQISSEH